MPRGPQDAKEWAVMGVYKELSHAAPRVSEILWAAERLWWDGHGELLPNKAAAVKAIHQSLDPDMGAGLGDRREWAEWLLANVAVSQG